MHQELISQVASLPNAPGVYLFYSSHDAKIPLYIGKSIKIKDRVRSHIYEAKNNAREHRLMSQVKVVKFNETAGELGALLLESNLIKKFQPLYNRRLKKIKSIFFLTLNKSEPTWSVEICSKSTSSFLPTAESFGIYKNKRQCVEFLINLSREHQLCPIQLSLESKRQVCFNYQLKRCLGVCCGSESSEIFNHRLSLALEEYQHHIWPYEGVIAIIEPSSDGHKKDVHYIDRWRYQYTETLAPEDEVEFLRLTTKNGSFDRDVYNIISRFMLVRTNNLVIRHPDLLIS